MFITLEGIEGSGKSTLLKALVRFFETQKKNVLVTREPGGSELGLKLRAIILNATENICPTAELFLFLADRAQHVHDVIQPALLRGQIVICDRYVDSTIAYQGYGRGMDLMFLKELNKYATQNLVPNKTFLLDLPTEKGLERAKKRNQLENLTESEGRFEAEELSFHTKIREGFLALAEENPHRYVYLDATMDAKMVASIAIKNLMGDVDQA